jgi:nucleotide-binding universal stress UspA family protein
MLDHVLVPLDESELSESALDYVSKLIGEGSRVTLLTTIVPPDLSLSSLYAVPSQPDPSLLATEEGLSRQLRVQAEAYLRKKIERLEKIGAKVETLVQVGQPADSIVEAAAELRVDAIIMATHGRSGVSRWLLGSVTQKVLSAAPCPVFVIPSRSHAN